MSNEETLSEIAQLGQEMDAIDKAVVEFDNAVECFVEQCLAAGAYMPAISTRLRLHADELADRFPDDANQTMGSTEDAVYRQHEKT